MCGWMDWMGWDEMVWSCDDGATEPILLCLGLVLSIWVFPIVLKNKWNSNFEFQTKGEEDER